MVDQEAVQGLTILSFVTAQDRNDVLVKEKKLIQDKLMDSQRSVKLLEEREQLYCSRLVQADQCRDKLNKKITDLSTKYELLEYNNRKMRSKFDEKEEKIQDLMQQNHQQNEEINKLHGKIIESAEQNKVYQTMWNDSWYNWQDQQSLIVEMRKVGQEKQNKIRELKAEILRNKYIFEESNQSLKEQNESLKEVIFESQSKEKELLKQIEELNKRLRSNQSFKDELSADVKECDL